MAGDPVADAWTTVDRKTAKKKAKEPEDEGWSQVSKDRRGKEGGSAGRPDRTHDRRGDRRGDRGKPPPRGGSANRNTLPRRQGPREGGVGGPRDGGAGGPRDGGAGGPKEGGTGQGWPSNRTTPSPTPYRQQTSSERRPKPVPVSSDAGAPQRPVPQDNIPRKPSWANRVTSSEPPADPSPKAESHSKLSTSKDDLPTIAKSSKIAPAATEVASKETLPVAAAAAKKDITNDSSIPTGDPKLLTPAPPPQQEKSSSNVDACNLTDDTTTTETAEPTKVIEESKVSSNPVEGEKPDVLGENVEKGVCSDSASRSNSQLTVETSTKAPLETCTDTLVETSTETLVETCTETTVETSTETSIETLTETLVETSANATVELTEAPVELTKAPVEPSAVAPLETSSSVPVENSTTDSIETCTKAVAETLPKSTVEPSLIVPVVPAEREGLTLNIDDEKADSPVQSGSEHGHPKDSNGNTVQLDDNKNETKGLEELISTINPETRHYDRDILLQLQRHPLSLQKPEKLPELEIVLDCPMRASNSAPHIGDTPSQYVSAYSRGGGNLPTKRDSRRKESSKKVISLSREPVKLHKSEDAWVPSTKLSNETTEVDQLANQVRAILNKLTPQNFDTLVVRFKALVIDSEEKLVQCMELVFEKAVSEPAFSTAYASLCNELLRKMVSKDNSSEPVDFRMLLLRRCQKEFEKEYISDAERTKFAQEMDAADSEDEKKRIKAEFGQLELRLRRRSLGNIKFIGELYKLSLLKLLITHKVVQRLIRAKDEESLESLCQLLGTCGSRLEADEVNIPVEHRKDYLMDNYMNQIQKIVTDKLTSSRVRFLLQDVVDLRNNRWVSRRQEAGPKTIKQIHKEARLEELQIQLQDQKPMPPVSRRSEEQQNRRKTEYQRPKPLPEEELWSNVPRKAAKLLSDSVDPQKMRPRKVDADSLKLGPSVGWGFSSTGLTTGRAAPQVIKNTNRFQMLEDAETTEPSPPASYHGRASEPAISYHQRGADREEAESSGKSRSTLRGDPDSDLDTLRTRSNTLMEEFIVNCDLLETMASVCELFHPTNIASLVEQTFNIGIEKKRELDRRRCGELLLGLLRHDVLTVESLCSGMSLLLEIASDMIIDIPKFWDLLADILAPLLLDCGHFEAIIEESCKSIETEGLRKNFLKSLLLVMSTVNRGKFSTITLENKPCLEKLLAQNFESYLADNCIAQDAPPKPEDVSAEEVVLVNGSLQEDLYRKLTAVFDRREMGNNELSTVDRVLSDKVLDKDTVRTIVTAVIESAVDGVGGQCTLNKGTLSGRIPILKKYIDANKTRELFALYAIQSLVTRLEHPNKLLHSILEELYEAECISDDGLYDWEKSEDPEEQEGKGVALKSCNQLFIWLKTPEEEEEGEQVV